jgi:hypothetical protein
MGVNETRQGIYPTSIMDSPGLIFPSIGGHDPTILDTNTSQIHRTGIYIYDLNIINTQVQRFFTKGCPD